MTTKSNLTTTIITITTMIMTIITMDTIIRNNLLSSLKSQRRIHFVEALKSL
ncbi:MAG TPA: hypothetical protein PKW79_04375 [Rhabdochlamydiaceae bacterium]|nr:hypothetical protein [Rhabdochlamydiaceae bacterium]